MYNSYSGFKPAHKTDNPIINLTFHLIKSDNLFTKNLIPIYEYILENNEFDINENFYLYHKSYSETQIIKKNLFDIVSTIYIADYNPTYISFFKKLFEKGLKIKDETIFEYSHDDTIKDKITDDLSKEELEYLINNSNPEISYQHSLFQNNDLIDELKILFLKEAQNQYKNNYLKKIQEYKTYHNSVSYGNDRIVALFESQGIPVNILDKDNKTPLMYANQLKMVKILEDLGANWLLLDNNNKDALSHFAEISDTKESSKLMEYGRKISQTLFERNNIDNRYIEDRNSMNLLSLVNSGKNKVELKKFIAKNHINNIGSIVDSENNNLFMISISQYNWSRANLFMEYIDDETLSNKNTKGLTALNILLQGTDRIVRAPTSTPIVERLLKHYKSNLNQETTSIFSKTANFLLKTTYGQIINGFQLPEILFCPENIKHLSILGFNVPDLISNGYSKYKRTYYPTKNEMENSMNFYLDGFVLEKKINPNIKFDFDIEKYLNGTFYIQNHYNTSRYKIEKDLFKVLEKYIKKLSTIDKELYVHTLTEVNKKIVSFTNNCLIDIEEKLDDDFIITKNKHTFLDDISEMLLFLIENNNLEYFHQFKKDVMLHEYQNENINRTINYIELNQTLEVNNKTQKPIKI